MGTFERFTMKTHFNTLKRLVLLVGLAVLAVKLAVTVLWAAPTGSPPASTATRPGSPWRCW